MPLGTQQRQFFTWVAIFGLAACHGSNTTSGDSLPTRLTVVAGSLQSARVNTELPDWVRLLVTDQNGRPMPGVHVKLDGDGTTPVNEMITDGTGTISLHWTLGPLSGDQELVAKIARVDSVTIIAHATGCDKPECPEYELAEGEEAEVNIPTFELSGQVVHPDVVRRKGPKGNNWYWMAITPYPNGNAFYENPSIFRGLNGRYWRIPKGVVNPLVWPVNGYLSDPDIVLDEPTNKLWLFYRLVAFDQNIIMVIKSDDGIKWSKPDTLFSVAQHGAVSPAVVHNAPGAPWQMWVVDAGTEGCMASTTTVKRRTSTDGMRWSGAFGTDLQQPGEAIWHLDVVYVPARSEYWALYTTHPKGMNCSTRKLYLARSTDGITWQIPKSPIYAAGSNPFFKDVVYRSSILPSEDGINASLWLSGANLQADNWSLIWSAATVVRRIDDLMTESAKLPSAANVEVIHELPIPEIHDMPAWYNVWIRR